MNIKAFFLSLLILIQTAHAESTSEKAESETDFMNVSLEELADVNITSITKMAMPLNKSPVAAYVIKQDEINRKGYRFLPEILKNTPDFHVIEQAASVNGLTKIYVRGVFANDKIAVLIDGIKVKPPTSEPAMFYSSIPLIGVKQVEISLGSSSSVYGADAMLATINIVSENGADLDGFKIKATGAEAATAEVQVATGKKINDDISFSLTGSFHRSNQEDSTQNYLTALSGNRGTIDVAEQNHSLHLNVDYKKLSLTYYRLQNSNENSLINGKSESGNAFWDITHQLANATYNLEITPFWQAKSSLSYETTELLNNSTYKKPQPPLPPSAKIISPAPSAKPWGNGGSTFTVAETLAYLRGNTNWLNGVELNFMTPGDLDGKSLPSYEDYAVYSQLSYDITESLSLNGSVRMDADSRFDPNLNPRIGFSWQAMKEFRLFGAWGTSYLSTAPFKPLSARPEELRTSELGFNLEPFKNNTLNASWFTSDGKNIARPAPQNQLTILETYGFQVTERQKFENGISADMNYTFTDGKQYGTQNYLNFVPKHMVKSNLMYDFDKFTFRFTGRWFDELTTVQPQKSYNTLILDSNLHYSQPFKSTNWSVDLGVTNLLDIKYYTEGYNPDGLPRFQQETRRVYLTVGLSY